MKFSSADLGKTYTVEQIMEGVPCLKCTPCMRLRIMEMGLSEGERIFLRSHTNGIWLIDILSEKGNVSLTLALRDEETERICLLD
jgi:Fe2+ transport system protein FeoA